MDAAPAWAVAAETDPSGAGSPGLPGEELGRLQALTAAPQGPKHWNAVAGQGLTRWACPFSVPHTHEVTQTSSQGEAIRSKPVTQPVRPSLPRSWGAGSRGSCYNQGCFPSAQHPWAASLASHGCPGSGGQGMPPPDPRTSSSLPREQEVPELLYLSPHQRTLPAAKHNPGKIGDSQPCLRATREAAGTHSTPGPRTDPPGPHPAPAAPVLPVGSRQGNHRPRWGRVAMRNETPSCFDPTTAGGCRRAASSHSPRRPLIPSAGAAVAAQNRG